MDPSLLVAIAAALLLFGLISGRAERGLLSAPMAFVALGFAIGTEGLGWLQADKAVIHGLAELTLVIVLFTDAARIDLTCLRREESLPARLLTMGLPLTIALGAGAALLIVPGVGPFEALLLAAILAPTDAALGQAVVSSPLVPLRIRQTLNVESGLNDGIALPVVLLAASLVGARAEGGDFVYWLRFAGLQVVLGPIVGIAVGWIGGKVLERAVAAEWISGSFQRLSVLALAVLAYAAADLVHGNGFIAAFVAGLTLGGTARSICGCLYEFGEAEGQLLTLLVFMLFGGIIVPEVMGQWNAPALVYALLSLTLIRMLPVALALYRSGLQPSSLVFVGWFGPRGLASILFAMLVVEDVDGDLVELLHSIEAVVMLTVLLSVIAHGMSAYPAARRYGAAMEAAGDAAPEEQKPVMKHPVRIRHLHGAEDG
jgi:NhaP-type Na+/H+ or K+/H+ antiporter